MSSGCLPLAEVAQYVLGRLSTQEPLADDMDDLIRWCAIRRAHPAWNTVRALPFDRELERLTTWLDALLAAEPPSPEVDAFYFGLFNPIRDDVVSADLYAAGGVHSEPEWVCRVGRHWWPDGRYADSPVMSDVYRIASDSDLGNDVEYPIGLGFSVFAARELARRCLSRLVSPTRPKIWFVAGFDGGDILNVGHIDGTGLHIEPHW